MSGRKEGRKGGAASVEPFSGREKILTPLAAAATPKGSRIYGHESERKTEEEEEVERAGSVKTTTRPHQIVTPRGVPTCFKNDPVSVKS